MTERNTHHEQLCDFSDLPESMCAHCQGHNQIPEPLGLHTPAPATKALMKPITLASYIGQPLYSTLTVPDADTDTPCLAPNCQGTCKPGYRICPSCLDQLETDLANMPALLEDLAVAQRRESTATHRTSRRGRRESVAILEGWPGFDEKATDPNTIVTAQLAAQDAAARWSRILGANRPDQASATDLLHELAMELQRATITTTRTPPESLDSTRLAANLRARLDRIARTEAAPTIAGQIRTLAARAIHLIDNAPECIDWGTCATPVAAGTPHRCGQQILIPVEQDIWTCPGCGTVYDADELWQARLDRVRPIYLTIAQLATITRIPPAKLRSRIRHRYVDAICQISGVNLYRAGDVLYVCADLFNRS